MKILKVTAAAVMSGVLIGAASLPAWPAMNAERAQAVEAEVMPAMDAPSQSHAASRRIAIGDLPDRHDNCAASHIYSMHDVVGDKQACIMNMMTIPGGGAPGSAR
jgi:hypothetical protein